MFVFLSDASHFARLCVQANGRIGKGKFNQSPFFAKVYQHIL